MRRTLWLNFGQCRLFYYVMGLSGHDDEMYNVKLLPTTATISVSILNVYKPRERRSMGAEEVEEAGEARRDNEPTRIRRKCSLFNSML